MSALKALPSQDPKSHHHSTLKTHPHSAAALLQASAFPNTEEELAQLQDIGGRLVQLTPEMIKELGSDQIYKIYQMWV